MTGLAALARKRKPRNRDRDLWWAQWHLSEAYLALARRDSKEASWRAEKALEALK